MPRQRPPATPPKPRLVTLARGTLLWRVETRVAAPADSPAYDLFRSARADDQRWGGRFDPGGLELAPFCYAATDDLTAIAEVLLRDVTWDTDERLVPRAQVKRRNLALVEGCRDLQLVSLTTLEQLSNVRQDTWLIHAEPSDYVLTQLWGDWLRQASLPHNPDRRIDGLIWPSKRNPEGRALVLFGGSGDQLARSRYGSLPLDDAAGRAWLNRRLSVFSTRIAKRHAR